MKCILLCRKFIPMKMATLNKIMRFATVLIMYRIGYIKMNEKFIFLGGSHYHKHLWDKGRHVIRYLDTKLSNLTLLESTTHQT